MASYAPLCFPDYIKNPAIYFAGRPYILAPTVRPLNRELAVISSYSRRGSTLIRMGWTMDVKIRLATEADAGQMLAIYGPVVRDTVISFEEEPPSLDEFRGRIRTVLERMPWLVSEIGSQLAGYAYATPFRTRPGYRWTTEWTVYVHPAHHRRGVGRALYTALLACLRAQGYSTAVAVIALPNPASVALHESLGFRRTGTLERIGFKHGRWIDDGVWQLDIQPSLDSPAEPVPLGDFLDTPQWREALESGAALLRA